MSRSIGIDLGTTNSVVSYVTGDRVETIPNPEGSKLTPSVVLFGEEIIVGELAKRQSVTSHGSVIRSAKRLMGRRFSEVKDYIEDFPYEVVQGKDDRAEIRLADGRIVAPEVVAAQVLMKMRDTAEDFLGESVGSAVITVPAHFNDAQRTATRNAAELAELNVLRIINEPTAAALAYGFQAVDRAMKIAVFDFGGGTFDISILQLQGDVFEVLSTNGDTQLGGDNIDLKLFQEICDGILQQTGIDPTRDAQAVSRIREVSEKAKIELSSLSTTHVSLPFIVSDSTGPKHFEMELTRDTYNRWMMPIFQRLFEPCANALKDAHLTARDLDEIVMVGGSTRIPKVLDMVREFFGKEGNRTINPDEAISTGAAIQAGVMRGELAEVLLLDVTPLSLGIELAGGVFKVLIERNSSIPCEATRKFTTVVDNQTTVLVHVLQGERGRASENRTLAKFRLSDIPAMPKELGEIEVTFRIDADGILEVSAVELTSGASTGISIEGYGEFAAMSEDEKKRILEEIVMHGKEDEDFVRTASRRAQADRVQDRMRKIVTDAADAISEPDMKKIMETMLRHDLAISARDFPATDAHERILNDLADLYESAAEMSRELNRKFDAVNPLNSPESWQAIAESKSPAGNGNGGASGAGGGGGGGATGGGGTGDFSEDEIEYEAEAPKVAAPAAKASKGGAGSGGGSAAGSGAGASAPRPAGSIRVQDGVVHAEDDFNPAFAPPPPPPAG